MIIDYSKKLNKIAEIIITKTINETKNTRFWDEVSKG